MHVRITTHTFQRFALRQIGIMTRGENASFVASHDSLKETGINLVINRLRKLSLIENESGDATRRTLKNRASMPVAVRGSQCNSAM